MTDPTLAECPPEERARLLDALEGFYGRFAEAVSPEAGFPRPEGTCSGCGRCCVGPPLYMTCSDLEFELMLRAFEGPGSSGGARVHFEALGPDRPDLRKVHPKWACPFYSEARGCTVYPFRPFACRVFGPLSQVPIWWDFCGYQRISRLYGEPDGIPLWGEFAALIRSYRARWGYAYPDRLVLRDDSAEVVENPWEPSGPRLGALRLHTGTREPGRLPRGPVPPYDD